MTITVFNRTTGAERTFEYDVHAPSARAHMDATGARPGDVVAVTIRTGGYERTDEYVA